MKTITCFSYHTIVLNICFSTRKIGTIFMKGYITGKLGEACRKSKTTKAIYYDYK